MNEKAKFLGIKHTHFTNPQGFDNTEHYSSANDWAVLTHYALTNYPLIAQIVKQDFVQLPIFVAAGENIGLFKQVVMNRYAAKRCASDKRDQGFQPYSGSVLFQHQGPQR